MQLVCRQQAFTTCSDMMLTSPFNSTISPSVSPIFSTVFASACSGSSENIESQYPPSPFFLGTGFATAWSSRALSAFSCSSAPSAPTYRRIASSLPLSISLAAAAMRQYSLSGSTNASSVLVTCSS